MRADEKSTEQHDQQAGGYSPPTVTVLGRVAELTHGENGSNFDPGQGTFTKKGNG